MKPILVIEMKLFSKENPMASTKTKNFGFTINNRIDLYSRRKYIFLLVIIFFSSNCYSQLIRGTVFDKNTDEVIPFAAIYFSGTTMGTTSNENGYFELKLPEDLSNPLIISSVGYYSATITNFESSENLTIQLEPKTYSLKDVEVTADKSRNIRKRYFPVFRLEFLGKKLSPKSCRIMNEDDILLQFDRNTKILRAFSRRPIQIQNDQLGYNISYFLDHFEFNTITRSMVLIGNYKFTPISVLDSVQQEEIKNNRANAYLGSRMHFFRTLWDDSYKASGFKVLDTKGNNLSFNKMVVEKMSAEGRILQKYLVWKGPLVVYYGGLRRKSMIIPKKDFVSFECDGHFDPLGVEWDGYIGNKRIADLLPYEYIASSGTLKK